MKEDRETYYTLDLLPSMSKEDVFYLFNELYPLALKMLKDGSVQITCEPVIEGEQK
ncbi:hypothetical protein [Polynucleobacter sphagniphilus]|jgi:F0F1-type ATP synthase alpha subunit|uniref:hypothetical protein n=1 Tax=Polynucleobacter sphagniphilus TaxID=1743169 RepID=UPI0024747AF9|nr:hypothetical protein [Polynucleobacter sphagniphilus]